MAAIFESVGGVLIWTVAVIAVMVVLAYWLKSTAIFNTKGHTSSEFKIVLLMNACLIVTLWLSHQQAGAVEVTLAHGLLGAVVALGAAAVNTAYVLSRGSIKAARLTACKNESECENKQA